MFQTGCCPAVVLGQGSLASNLSILVKIILGSQQQTIFQSSSYNVANMGFYLGKLLPTRQDHSLLWRPAWEPLVFCLSS